MRFTTQAVVLSGDLYKRRQSGDRRRVAELFQSSGVRDGNTRLALFRAHRAAYTKKAKEEKRPC